MSFFGKKKTTREEYKFTLKDIDVAKVDKEFNMDNINNTNRMEIESGIDFDISAVTTSIDKLGISTLKTQPITTIVSRDRVKLQTFVGLVDHVSQRRLPLQTDIPCYGCHRRFSTVPLGIPVKYHPSVYREDDRKRTVTVRERSECSDKVTVNEYFEVESIVCSFNCMYNVIEDCPSSIYRESKLLIPLMYRTIFGEYPKTRIYRSPSWRLRREYGGPLDDKEWCENLQVLRISDTHQVERFVPVGRVWRVEEITLTQP